MPNLILLPGLILYVEIILTKVILLNYIGKRQYSFVSIMSYGNIWCCLSAGNIIELILLYKWRLGIDLVTGSSSLLISLSYSFRLLIYMAPLTIRTCILHNNREKPITSKLLSINLNVFIMSEICKAKPEGMVYWNSGK